MRPKGPLAFFVMMTRLERASEQPHCFGPSCWPLALSINPKSFQEWVERGREEKNWKKKVVVVCKCARQRVNGK